MANLQNLKIPVFPNINDQPRVPTDAKAGNAADLIARYNQLVDIVQFVLNGSTPNSGATINWTIFLPESEEVEALLVYYLNVSENYLFANYSINVMPSDLVYVKTINSQDRTEGVDLYDPINLCGNGYYFFVLKTFDNNYKQDSWFTEMELIPKGIARQTEEFLSLSIYDENENSVDIARIRPLVVTEALGKATLNLTDTELVIG